MRGCLRPSVKFVSLGDGARLVDAGGDTVELSPLEAMLVLLWEGTSTMEELSAAAITVGLRVKEEQAGAVMERLARLDLLAARPRGLGSEPVELDHRVPALRKDLRFTPLPGTGATRVTDPRNGLTFTLADADVSLGQRLDGVSSPDAVLSAAANTDLDVEALRGLVGRLRAYGFLDEPSTGGSPAPAPAAPANAVPEIDPFARFAPNSVPPPPPASAQAPAPVPVKPAPPPPRMAVPPPSPDEDPDEVKLAPWMTAAFQDYLVSTVGLDSEKPAARYITVPREAEAKVRRRMAWSRLWRRARELATSATGKILWLLLAALGAYGLFHPVQQFVKVPCTFTATTLGTPLAPRTGSLILKARDGAKVSAGELLAELDPAPLEARRQELEARQQKARAREVELGPVPRGQEVSQAQWRVSQAQRVVDGLPHDVHPTWKAKTHADLAEALARLEAVTHQHEREALVEEKRAVEAGLAEIAALQARSAITAPIAGMFVAPPAKRRAHATEGEPWGRIVAAEQRVVAASLPPGISPAGAELVIDGKTYPLRSPLRLGAGFEAFAADLPPAVVEGTLVIPAGKRPWIVSVAVNAGAR